MGLDRACHIASDTPYPEIQMKITPIHIGIALGIILIILYLSRNKIKEAMTRGYKNNNPGNIEDDGVLWIGQKAKSTDPPFKQFVSMPYGYRALFINLKGAINGGYNTINKLITRYAPPKRLDAKTGKWIKENDTPAYIAAVSKQTGVKPDTLLNFNDAATMRKIVMAISQHENGIVPNPDDVDQGYKLLHIA